MKLSVVTRFELVAHAAAEEGPALLLEGSWPEPQRGNRRALDEEIDGRFDAIDRQAADWAERLADVDTPGDFPPPAMLNVLPLRYCLVKLIRVAQYFTRHDPLSPGDCLELTAATGRDQDYVDVLAEYCRRRDIGFLVRWIDRGGEVLPTFPPNARWRRWAAKLAQRLRPPILPDPARRRVVLCGNPRLLESVCHELLARNCQVWWLYDRFALKSWLRWQGAGVGQLVCDSSLAQENRFSEPSPEQPFPGEFDVGGIDLSGPIRRWIAGRTASHGPRQTQILRRIEAHFRHIRPDAIVLDEDATPLARAAVLIGRRHGATSAVVQHGVPCCRFGFAPLLADRILVWGTSSAERLVQWGIPPDRIRITGSPQHDRWTIACGRKPPRHGPRILLLATVPPRDARPDAVSQHLTSRTNARMLRMAFAATAAIDHARLTVKLHPRTGDDPMVEALRAEFHSLDTRIVRRGPLPKWFDRVDCVLSCGSSAGVEATLAGVPVVQLAPPSATSTFADDGWGFVGTARDEATLHAMLVEVLAGIRVSIPGPCAAAFRVVDGTAAARVAEEVLGIGRATTFREVPVSSVRGGPDVPLELVCELLPEPGATSSHRYLPRRGHNISAQGNALGRERT